uniref:Uncharacterized protein n=1 Tax=Chromera velia CCMP2878 TaxID=1169474 RepID=A0A0G4FLN2_9ALVE|eukprot:Cvel_17633.t1-p1 / transcript=Cvel_17633.t1 / gene=Cvel_17633 / organism=Chromera_velia_CCMP2878 / gene_product=hypothetical protein / transcript_product=hypothetical protein / location=Cvel_scaffold1419:38545-40997(-) / protein_length=193 / sequence_SO=supercontig / SO=protein_coding / is_pseudo=false
MYDEDGNASTAFGLASLEESSSFETGRNAGRLFGCVVPERLRKSGFPLRPSQLKKVGDAFFSFGQNAVLLDSTANLDDVLRALRTFLQMHSTVILWVASVHGLALECWLPLAPSPSMKESAPEEGEVDLDLFGASEGEEEKGEGERGRDEGMESEEEDWLERALPAPFVREDRDEVYSVNVSDADEVQPAPRR